MDTQIQKWGNSLALRIPKALAAQGNLEQGTPVKVTVENGAVVIRPQRKRKNLQELLAKVTPENIHPEMDFGPPVGKEIW
jgi:antitoxin MazE